MKQVCNPLHLMRGLGWFLVLAFILAGVCAPFVPVRAAQRLSRDQRASAAPQATAEQVSLRIDQATVAAYLPVIVGESSTSATPTPTPSMTPTGEPTPTATSTATPTPTPTATPTGQPVGTLDNNGVFYGLDGIRLGALATSLSEPIAVTMTVTTPPTQTLPAGVTVRSNFYHLAANSDLNTTMQAPLLVALPVPSGADGAHLALGVLDRNEPFAVASDLTWHFLDGLYDTDQGLFLTTLSFLSAQGNVFVLAEHDSFQSPPNGSVARAADASIGAFTVGCRNFASPDDCSPAIEEQVATYLDQIQQRMRDTFGFTRLPRLQSPLGQIVLAEDQNSLAFVSGFTAYVVPQTYFRCDRAAGLYRSSRGLLYLCFDPNQGLTPTSVATLIHEYFHAIQYGYPNVYATGIVEDPPPPPEAWIIEGMANMVEASYDLDDGVVRSLAFNDPLFIVDESLLTPDWGDADVQEYSAQDFWVYVGQVFEVNLSYLDAVLDKGATSEKVAAALEETFGIPFNEIYWGFVKNQVIENRYALGDEIGELCELTEPALTEKVSPILWEYSFDYFEYPNPNTSDDLYDRIDPLQARVIEIRFPANKPIAIIDVRLEACDGLFGNDRTLCQLEKQKELHSKIYVAGEPDCHMEPNAVEGKRTLIGPSTMERYYIVLANADWEEAHGYYILVE